MQIQRIDTGFMRSEFCGVFLLTDSDGVHSIIEAGSTLSVPPTLEFLEKQGISPAQIRNIFITHAHLDHMGGVGALAAACTGATVYCHPQARSHVIDPLSKLVPAAIYVYGQEVFDRDYPNVQCIPQERVVELQDQQIVDGVYCIHTPGHAFHHCCFIAGKALFSGDGFGFGFYRLGYCPLLCTSPSQYDGVSWAASAKRIMDLVGSGYITTIYPTHFDSFYGAALLQSVGESVFRQIQAYNLIIEQCNTKEEVKQAYLRVVCDELQRFGCSDSHLAYELVYGDINVDGLYYRVQKRLSKK